ncbi:MAG: helix-turn-helix domain-containing protein [Mesonia sp.]|uniref:helix-turn-helix domain-containing protein n=1 Tax=Mesonia sp. TaxID=1960830 RepID=UPI003F950195
MSTKNFSVQDWEQIIQRLEATVTKLQNVLQQDPKHIILDNADLLQIFNISARTLQRWRDDNQISYSQIGSKIFYRMHDIQTFLDNNYHQVSLKSRTQ